MARPKHFLVERLFQQALDLPDHARDAFLGASGATAEILNEVRALLVHHEPGRELFRFPSKPESRHPQRIGPFMIDDVLGEGGMGIVYRATQTKPVRRSVALKLVKLGMDSREILDRFEQERQALAQLQHSNVATIFEAGVSVDGRPYFAMEYVDGEPIHHYCDRECLTPRQRLELLVEACRGVQEAHQRGIIHRDLKPGNILVTTEHGRPIPKIIDFGVAKATDQTGSRRTRFTQLGQLIGTPEYMSPEQAQGGQVDTRSDIYSLGVVLYELLAGVLPLDAERLRSAGFDGMMRMIREEEPSRPSTRVSTLGAGARELAKHRRTSPRRWMRSLRGELDWIALKALEKDPNDRYGSVGEFASDLTAHLNDEPIRAQPASALSAVRKFARRHRTGVSVASVVIAGLLAFAAAMLVQSMRVARERDRANLQSELAQQVTDFMADVFVGSDPGVAQGDMLTARQLLDRGAARIDEIEDPRVRAELSSTLAGVYESLGLLEAAKELTVRARSLYLEVENGPGPLSLSELNNLGNIETAMGYDATAESVYAEALAGWRSLGRAEDPRALDPLQNLAIVEGRRGRWNEAAAHLLEVAEIRRRRFGDDDPKLLSTLRQLAGIYDGQERHEEAAVIYEDVVERRRRVLGDDHPETITTIADLAGVHADLDRLAEAESLLTEAVERSRRVLGEEHPKTRNVLDQMAFLYFRLDEHEKARPILRSRVEYDRRQFGDDHPTTLTAMYNLGVLYAEIDSLEQAQPLLEDVIGARAKMLGEDHPYTRQTRYSLALIAARRGDYDSALRQLRIAVDHGFAHSMLLGQSAQDVLAPLSKEPGYAALIDTVRSRLKTRGIAP